MRLKSTAPEKWAVCPVDGVRFYVVSRPRKYCSRPCKNIGQQNRVELICEFCGELFRRPASTVEWHATRYDTRECYDLARVDARESIFDESVDRSSEIGCWPWTGWGLPKGYGIYGKPKRLAHRCAWEFASGQPIPDGLVVGHTCDNPKCVRNDDRGTYEIRGVLLPRFGHLWLGTTADNIHDMRDKGRGYP